MDNINLERLNISINMITKRNGLTSNLVRGKEYKITIYDGAELLFTIDAHGTHKETSKDTEFTKKIVEFMHGIYTNEIQLIDPAELGRNK